MKMTSNPFSRTAIATAFFGLVLSAAVTAHADDCNEVSQTRVETPNHVMVISTNADGQVTIVKIDKTTEAVSICTPNGGCTPMG